MTKAKKIGILVIVLVILVGAVMAVTMGFNYNTEYGNGKRIEVETKKDYELKDIKSIVKEVYGNANVEMQGQYRNGFSIKVKDTTDEQRTTLATKLNEKYGYEYTIDNIVVTNIGKVEVLDIVKPYIAPLCIATGIVVVYMMIMYRNNGVVKVILHTIITAILSVLVVLSVYAIARIPVTNVLMPIVLICYSIALIYNVKCVQDMKK